MSRADDNLELDVVLAWAADRRSVTVIGRVLRAGKPVPMPADFWPVTVVNPPDLVPDPAGDVLVTMMHPLLGEHVVMHRRDAVAGVHAAVLNAARAALGA